MYIVSRDDGWRLSAGEVFEPACLQRRLYDPREQDLRVLLERLRIVDVLLDVEADGGAAAPGATQAKDEAASVGEDEAEALLGRGRAVDGVGVEKVVRDSQGVVSKLVASLRRLETTNVS